MQTSGSSERTSGWAVVGAVAGGLALAGALTVGVALAWTKGKELGTQIRQMMPETASSAAQQRQERQTPVAAVAPAPIPSDLPLLGKPGRDADGYPTQYVDRPGLRSLLSHQRFADLTGYLERFQQEFETDPKREFWIVDACDAFDSAEPELAPTFDAWAAATPVSFAPYLARGVYWQSVAYARRGSKWAGETHADNFAAMRDATAKALADLDKAISLRPKLVHARSEKMGLLRLGSDRATLKSEFEKAIEVCPTCFNVRVVYIQTLRPRWGGSYPDMQKVADDAARVGNPRMRFLRGFVDLDKSNTLSLNKDYARALQASQRACTIGEYWRFLEERADAEMRLGDNQRALADLNRAVELRPGIPDLLFERAYIHGELKNWEAAGVDLLNGLRVHPTSEAGRRNFDWLLQGLDYQASELGKAGRRDDALRVIDVALELSPTNRTIQGRKMWIVMGQTTDLPNVPALEKAAAEHPDDFRAQQQLDYALSRTGAGSERIVKIWDAYLARRPNDGHAYLERAGAYYHLRQLKEAYADAAKACELGVSEGCARAKQVGPH